MVKQHVRIILRCLRSLYQSHRAQKVYGSEISEDLDGARKRDLLDTVIERVVCRKGGGVFLPGLFACLLGDTV